MVVAVTWNKKEGVMPMMAYARLVLRLVLVGVAVLLVQPVWAAKSAAPKPEAATLNCASQDNPQANFAPRAYTLASVYVRAKVPEYSFMRGQWILGETQGILAPKTCLHILKREEIGVIQVWYWVRYLDAAKQVRTGWVWAGTKNKDEGSYIGGDTTPQMTSRPSQEDSPAMVLSWFFIPSAFAQGDALPSPATIPDDVGRLLPKPRTAEDLDYLVEVPLLGWAVSYSTVSAMVLFVAMLAGMVAKAVWDETGGEKGNWPAWNKMFRPFLVSPIAFSAFWGPMYAQQDGGGLSLTMALYAFQIGFMWQHVLEKKVGGN
jgi:hypothetical protein